jgi:nicotinate-nucleotide adenylyltransferase
MSKERIGVFGGTFDPIHSGHLWAARLVQKRFSLDRVLFVPSYIPPHKERAGMASPFDRLKMVELAVQGHARFLPSPVEIHARGKSYSINTLEKIKKLYPQARIFFLVGVDAFLEIETWREWRRLLKQCLFIVMTRPGYRLKEAWNVLDRAYRKSFRSVSKSGRIRKLWLNSCRIFLLPIEAKDISSTEIRERIRLRKPIRGLVPRAVEDYIHEHRLYRTN